MSATHDESRFQLPVIMPLIKKVGPSQNHASLDHYLALENPGSAIARTRGNKQKESEMVSLLPPRVQQCQ